MNVIVSRRVSSTGSSRRLVVLKAIAAVFAVMVFGALASTSAQPGVYGAQLEYQQSRVEAYRRQRAAEGLIGSALPAGEYAWTMEFRCDTYEACLDTFGFPLLPPWQTGFTFVAHLSSDGYRMHYTGANVYRGRDGADEPHTCEDPMNVAFSGTCVAGETAEVFVVFDPSYPATELVGRPWLWVRNANQFMPLATGGHTILPCACGPDAVATPTIAVPMTLGTEFFAGGREVLPGVELTVQLVKLP